MIDQSIYRNIIENLSAGVLLVGNNRRIQMGNASIREFLGLPEEIVGKTLAEVFFECDGEKYDRIVDLVLEVVYNDNENLRVPVDYELAGEKKHFLASSYAVKDEGEPMAVVLVIEDITELSELKDAHSAKQEILRLNESLDRRNELIKKTYGQELDDERVEALIDENTVSEQGAGKRVIVSLRGVVKEYGEGEHLLRVLKGIDLDIYEHEFLVILGESGCGKSTMMNIVGGMDFMTEGSLIVEGKDFSHPSEKELTEFRRNYVGFVFQSYNLMPNLTARENVKFVAEITKNPLAPEDAIAKVGLSDRGNNYPSEMSGGQQQRVSIARALVKNPTLILADEPTAALDFSTSIEVLTVIEDVVHVQGKTVCMITHNEEIAKMADRVVRLKDGKVSAIRTNLHPLSAKELLW